jgi:soluble P-type ATPase
MTVIVEVPGGPTLRLEHLLLDVNGTLTDRGRLIPGVAERLAALRAELDVRLLTADTYGTLPEVAAALGGVASERVSDGRAKADTVGRLGAAGCVAVGNGANDERMLRAAVLGIAVLGPEGTSTRALTAADVACASVLDALDLLRDPVALTATLRP